MYPTAPNTPDPYEVKPLDANDRKFIEYLFTQQTKSMGNFASDVQVCLNAVGDVLEWRATQKVGNHQAILKKFTEGSSRDKSNPAVLYYPQIMGMSGPDSVKFKICLIANFAQGGVPSTGQLEALRKVNHSSIVEFFKMRLQETRKIESNQESNPGKFLTQGQSGALPNYIQLSYEIPLVEMARKYMVKEKLNAPGFKVFRKDILYLACEELKILKRVSDNFYLPLVNGQIPHDEVIYCYRITADAFEDFIRSLTKKQPKLGPVLKKFDQTFPVDKQRKQKQDRILALIRLIEGIVNPTDSNPVIQRLLKLMITLKALMVELAKKYEKFADVQILKKTEALKTEIIQTANNDFNALTLDPAKVFPPEVFNNPEYTKQHSQAVIDNLMAHKTFCFAKKGEGEGASIQFAFLPLLYRIEAQAVKERDKEKQADTQKLIGALPTIRPEVKSYKKTCQEHDRKIYNAALLLLEANKSEVFHKKQEKDDKLTRAILLIAGIAAIAGAAMSVGAYAALATFDAMNAFFIGLIAGFAVFMVARILAKKVLTAMHAEKPEGGKGAAPGKAAAPSLPPDLVTELEQAFNQGDDPVDHVYTPKQLMSIFQGMNYFKDKVGKPEFQTEVKKIQKSLGSFLTVIRIPAKKIPQGHSGFIYLSKEDFKVAERRKVLGNYFRKQSDFKSQGPSLDKKESDYYGHIANEIEFNADRYLRG